MAPPAKQDSVIREALREWSLPLLLALALLLGGGGSPSPATELTLQLLFAVVAVAAFWAGCFRSPTGRTAWLVACLAAWLPVLQLIPLPPSVWSALPGREPIVRALELFGAQDQWRAASIAPYQTRASLLSLGPPLVILVLAAASSDDQLRRAAWVIIVMAVCAAILGTVQVATAGTAGHLYDATHRGWVTGFFANRNAAADLFVIALIAALAIGWRHSKAQEVLEPPPGTLLVLALLLTVATVMTGSRLGIALLLLTNGSFAMYFASRSLRNSRRKALVVGGAVILGLGMLISAGWAAGGLRSVATRFGASGDMRAEIWHDTWHAIERFWPAGSGLGTFEAAFAPSQRLETIGPAVINRAHNDYLELALEGGPAALLILALIAVVLFKNAFARWHSDLSSRDLLVFGGGALSVLALHSAADYPLRTMALAVICAFAAGILAKPRQSA